MVDLEEQKLRAEIEKLHSEVENLSAETQKATEEARKVEIESKYVARGVGYWLIEGLKIFAAGILGFGGLTAAISG
jgi:hypothetical protein